MCGNITQKVIDFFSFHLQIVFFAKNITEQYSTRRVKKKLFFNQVPLSQRKEGICAIRFLLINLSL